MICCSFCASKDKINTSIYAVSVCVLSYVLSECDVDGPNRVAVGAQTHSAARTHSAPPPDESVMRGPDLQLSDYENRNCLLLLPSCVKKFGHQSSQRRLNWSCCARRPFRSPHIYFNKAASLPGRNPFIFVEILLLHLLN